MRGKEVCVEGRLRDQRQDSSGGRLNSDYSSLAITKRIPGGPLGVRIDGELNGGTCYRSAIEKRIDLLEELGSGLTGEIVVHSSLYAGGTGEDGVVAGDGAVNDALVLPEKAVVIVHSSRGDYGLAPNQNGSALSLIGLIGGPDITAVEVELSSPDHLNRAGHGEKSDEHDGQD